MFNKIKYLYIILWLGLIGLAGCKQVPMLPGVGAHKIDIQQGNVVTQEMVAKLQPGMSRSQVRFVLGTPLLVDPFREDRWDYFYSYRTRGELTEQRRLVVFFKDDKLDRLEGDVIAAKPGPAKTVDDKGDGKPAATAIKPEAIKPAAKPEAATLTTGDGVPVGSGVSTVVDKPASTAKPEVKAETKPVAAKPDVKAEDKPKEERGFFGRLLDKIGL